MTLLEVSPFLYIVIFPSSSMPLDNAVSANITINGMAENWRGM
jgi:hypothetical protein